MEEGEKGEEGEEAVTVTAVVMVTGCIGQKLLVLMVRQLTTHQASTSHRTAFVASVK